MPLIACVACGHQTSLGARFCPKCGAEDFKGTRCRLCAERMPAERLGSKAPPVHAQCAATRPLVAKYSIVCSECRQEISPSGQELRSFCANCGAPDRVKEWGICDWCGRGTFPDHQDIVGSADRAMHRECSQWHEAATYLEWDGYAQRLQPPWSLQDTPITRTAKAISASFGAVVGAIIGAFYGLLVTLILVVVLTAVLLTIRLFGAQVAPQTEQTIYNGAIVAPLLIGVLIGVFGGAREGKAWVRQWLWRRSSRAA